MDMGDSLRSLGLGRYEAAFHENEIDGKVLPKLTAENLKYLGFMKASSTERFGST